jgi:hypothetical protein
VVQIVTHGNITADEKGLFHNMLPRKTFNIKVEQCPGGKRGKNICIASLQF